MNAMWIPLNCTDSIIFVFHPQFPCDEIDGWCFLISVHFLPVFLSCLIGGTITHRSTQLQNSPCNSPGRTYMHSSWVASIPSTTNTKSFHWFISMFSKLFWSDYSEKYNLSILCWLILWLVDTAQMSFFFKLTTQNISFKTNFKAQLS